MSYGLSSCHSGHITYFPFWAVGGHRRRGQRHARNGPPRHWRQGPRLPCFLIGRQIQNAASGARGRQERASECRRHDCQLPRGASPWQAAPKATDCTAENAENAEKGNGFVFSTKQKAETAAWVRSTHPRVVWGHNPHLPLSWFPPTAYHLPSAVRGRGLPRLSDMERMPMGNETAGFEPCGRPAAPPEARQDKIGNVSPDSPIA